ncbi:MAG TPA: hypothetical protein VK915_04310 [Gaiellaceae bacterium]|nr:hypothetical protein [Gaiellaceae bacterium]
MTTGHSTHRLPAWRRRRFLPETRLGRRAVGLAVAHVLLIFTWSLDPLGAFPGLAVGLAAGVVAFLALRRGDRAIAVFAAFVPLVNTVLFVVGSILIPLLTE